MFKASSGAVYRRVKAYAGGSRNILNQLLRDGNTVADYVVNAESLTGTLNASALANSIGAAGPLLQATGANQPIVLAYSGQRYGYIPGVAGNSFSTPNAAANTITGDIEIWRYIAPDSWTPAVTIPLVVKTQDATHRAYDFFLATTGKLTLRTSADGSTVTTTDTSTVATGFSAGQGMWVGVSRSAASGNVIFRTAPDAGNVPGVKTQLGTTVPGTAGAINATVSAVFVGANFVSAGAPEKAYRAQIYNGLIANGGTLAVDFNASDWPETTTNGATATSSTTGEVWTLVNTGPKLAQIVASPQLLFDGTAHFMSVALSLSQPITDYLVFNAITWANTDKIFDSDSRVILGQQSLTPQMEIYAGTAVATNANLAVNTYGVVTCVFNGASSSLKVNGTAATTGNAGAAATGANCYLACSNANNAFGNIQIKEWIRRNSADSAATQAQIQSLLKSLYSTP